jgi:hypothetical protein
VSSALATLAVVVATAGHNFTVGETQQRFRDRTGMPLVKFAAASTPDVTSLRTRPHETARFGEFQLFVLRPSKVGALRRVFTHRAAADGNGIHWVPDQAGGWIAVTVHRRNLVLAWFPPSPSHALDERWRRLRRAVSGFAPQISRP